jgi:hypothetical protein
VFSILFISGVSVALLCVLLLARELTTPMGAFMLLSFGGRLAIHDFVRTGSFFSGGVGGDCQIYENFAIWIANQWLSTGISYKTVADNAEMGKTTLPPNLFALVIYLNGGQAATLACTSLVALAACLTALDFYKLALSLGADRQKTLLLTFVLFSSPAMVFHSSDMYKDPLSMLFTFGAVASSVRISRKFSVFQAIIGGLCLVCLWFVRYYLVFVCVLPLAVGYMGFGSKNWLRPAGWTVVLVIAFAWLMQSAGVAKQVDTAWDLGTGANHLGNAYGGSSVTFAPGLGALPARLVYTLFAPFPWMGGSFGLQVGKIDTIVFYVIIARASDVFWRRRLADRSVLLGLGAFILPMTVSYALSLANIGLILRQRLPIVVVTGVVALVGTGTPDAPRRGRQRSRDSGAKKQATVSGRAPAVEGAPPPPTSAVVTNERRRIDPGA